MKHILTHTTTIFFKVGVLIACLLLLQVTLFAQTKSTNTQKPVTLTEKGLYYPNEMLTTEVDFKLKSQGKRKFSLEFNNTQSRPIVIRIYDIIGNLIHEETVLKKGEFKKTYEMDKEKTELFVVKVSNGKIDKAKSIFAIPVSSANVKDQ